MIKVIKHYWLPSLKNRWMNLEKKSSCSPFQYYSFVYQLWIDYLFVYVVLKKGIPVFVEIREDNDTKLIVPLFKHINGTYSFFGEINGSEYCDCIYADGEMVSRYLQIFHDFLDRKLFRGDMLSTKSQTYSCLSSISGFKENGRKEYVDISFMQGYEFYYKSLSSSVRQNLRTSYNRSIRDGIDLEFLMICGNKALVKCRIPYEDFLNIDNRKYELQTLTKHESNNWFSKMISLYVKRHFERYGLKTSFVKKFYLTHLNFSTRCLKSLPNSMTMILLINGQVAAFMSGYLDERGRRYIIPRLSINSDFRFYSPGILLINESILYFIKETNVQVMDLGMGTEEYKIKMGGVFHM